MSSILNFIMFLDSLVEILVEAVIFFLTIINFETAKIIYKTIYIIKNELNLSYTIRLFITLNFFLYLKNYLFFNFLDNFLFEFP